MAGDAYFPGSSFRHTAIRSGDILTDLGTLGGNRSHARDISDSGFLIGTSQIGNGGYRSFIWKDDKMDILRYVPGAIEGVAALSVNNHGQSVGYVSFGTVKDYINQAILWNGKKPLNLNDLLDPDIKSAGWILTTAHDINDNGWIVGSAYNTQTLENYAFLLSSKNPILPVPEPSNYALMVVGLLGLLGVMARRKNA